MPPMSVLFITGVAVVLGAVVQGGVGLGLGIVAAPVVTLLDPALMPGAMLVAGAVLPVLILAQEAGHTDWPGVSWALAGRVAGTVEMVTPGRDAGRSYPGAAFTPGASGRVTGRPASKPVASSTASTPSSATTGTVQLPVAECRNATASGPAAATR